MSLPEINNFANLTVEVQTEENRMPSLTLDEKNILGSPIDGLDALQQSLKHILSTERYSNTIYDHAYGVEFESLYGVDMAFARIDVERRIKEAIYQDDRVIRIENLSTEVERNILHVTFNVVSVFGEVEMEVELDDSGN